MYFLYFFLILSPCRTLSNLVQASAQYYPNQVKKHGQIEIVVNFLILKLQLRKNSRRCGKQFCVFMENNLLFRCRGREIWGKNRNCSRWVRSIGFPHIVFKLIVYFDVSNVNLHHQTFSTCEDSVHTFYVICFALDCI